MIAVLHAAEESSSIWETPLLPHPAELVIGTIFFVILYFVVAKFVVPMFEANYAARVDAIEGGLRKAEIVQQEAAQALATYQAQLDEARAEAARIRSEAQAEGAAIVAEFRARAQAEADRITAAAQQQIRAEKQAAMVQLRGEVGDLATELASKIVGEALADEVRQNRVVERFLAELEDQATVGSAL